MKNPNLDLKIELQKKGIRQYEIANALNIGEATFYRWMRCKLSDDKKERINNAIQEIIKKGA